MEQVVPGVEMYSEFPRQYLNAYVVDDVLVDSGSRWWRSRLLDQLQSREIRAHVLTHGHPDHQGKSAHVCDALDVPLLCHENERRAVETGNTRQPMPQNRTTAVLEWFAGGPGQPVSRTVSEGDTVGAFEVVETPGNAPGHISLWRERDGTVILGDVLANIDPWTLRQGLQLLPDRLSTDRERMIESARKIADLEPDVVCFGHGPPLFDGRRLQAFVATLGQ